MTATTIGTKLDLRKITARIGAEVTGLRPDLRPGPGYGGRAYERR